MTRVLIVANSFSPKDGGWGTVACYLERAMVGTEGVQVTRLEADRLARRRGSKISLLRDLWYAWQWRRFFAKADLVVCVCEPLFPVCAYHRLIRRNCQFVLLGHGTYIYYPFVRGWRRWPLRALARAVDRLFVVSRFTEARVREWYDGGIGIFSNGVDTKAVEPPPGPKHERIFLLVGEQKERKGIAYLLEAFKLLAVDHPEARLELAGNPSETYKALSQRLGIENKVRFLGKVSDAELARCYSRAWCHVLPSVNTHSSFEGFGLAHLEANAYGIPSIGSAETANAEVIKNGETGYLCRQRDAEDLYRKMKLLLEDDGLYNRMCTASRKHAESLSWEKVLPSFCRQVLEKEDVRP